MKKLIISLTLLLSGGGVGYFIGSEVTKKKWQKISDDEVASVKSALENYYKNKDNIQEKVKPVKKADTKTKSEPKLTVGKDSIDMDKLRNQQNYMDYTAPYKTESMKEGEQVNTSVIKPYVIKPEELGDCEYEIVTLYYYADGVLADCEWNIIKDVNGYVGSDCLNTFGMYEEDSVCVRNDNFGLDYEILLCETEYAETAPKGVTRVCPDDEE